MEIEIPRSASATDAALAVLSVYNHPSVDKNVLQRLVDKICAEKQTNDKSWGNTTVSIMRESTSESARQNVMARDE